MLWSHMTIITARDNEIDKSDFETYYWKILMDKEDKLLCYRPYKACLCILQDYTVDISCMMDAGIEYRKPTLQ